MTSEAATYWEKSETSRTLFVASLWRGEHAYTLVQISVSLKSQEAGTRVCKNDNEVIINADSS